MSNYFGIIGANYGDEGKGLVTKILAEENPGLNLNVLYNGGMQRGHTVVNNEGKSHIFHCFGSATFSNAATYWAEDFLITPEGVVLEQYDLGFMPAVLAHPKCRIVTPYDVLFNQTKEKLRGDLKHGSCGMGIYETITRNKKIFLTFQDLYNTRAVYDILQEIRWYYTNKLKALSIDPEPQFKRVNLDDFFYSIDFLVRNVKMVEDPFMIPWTNVFFEGGQGLALDMDNTFYYPYLTPSNTGSKGIKKIIGDENISLYYVTRPYFTRHGADPYFEENKEDFKDFIDTSNVPNEWQGSIRYGYHKPQQMYNRIGKDAAIWKKNEPWKVLFITQSNSRQLLVEKDKHEEAKSNPLMVFDEIKYINHE